MDLTAALIALGLALLAVLLAGGLALAARAWFVLRAERVPGKVLSEWRYTARGREMRYYRVAFSLGDGQRAEVRSTGTTSSAEPRVGDVVGVLLLEREGQSPKARIAAWRELWLVPVLCLLLGAVGAVALVSVLRAMN